MIDESAAPAPPARAEEHLAACARPLPHGCAGALALADLWAGDNAGAVAP